MKYRIIFMGTPDFAVPSLRELSKFHEICLVVSQPDKKKGRGKKIESSEIVKFAKEKNYEIAQPANIKDDDFYNLIEEKNADFFVVVAYGKIIPKRVLDLAKKAPINIHASLLPQYRGASPITSAILNQDNKTGVTSMLINEKMDEGDILLSSYLKIKETDTHQSLSLKLSEIGADLLIKTIENFDDILPIKQDATLASYTKILKKEDGRINWDDDARKIESQIRAFDPWPGSFFFLGDKRIKVFNAKVVKKNESYKAGEIIEKKDNLIIACKKDALSILNMQAASSKRMDTKIFLRGAKIEESFAR